MKRKTMKMIPAKMDQSKIKDSWTKLLLTILIRTQAKHFPCRMMPASWTYLLLTKIVAETIYYAHQTIAENAEQKTNWKDTTVILQ